MNLFRKQNNNEFDIEKVYQMDNFDSSIYSMPKITQNHIPEFLLSTESLTPLHIIAYFDRLEEYVYIENNSSLNFATQDTKGYSVLAYACLGGSIEIVTYIFSKIKDDPKQQEELEKLFKEDYQKPDHQLLILCTHSNCVEIMKILVENGYGIVNKSKGILCQIAGIAVSKCIILSYTEGIQYLLTLTNSTGQNKSALEIAATSSRNEAIKFLLQLPYTNNDLLFTLKAACTMNNEYAVKTILPYITDIDISPLICKDSAIHWICNSCNPNIIKMVLSKHPDLNRLDENNKTGIYHIKSKTNLTQQNYIEILELLAKAGYDMKSKTCPPLGNFLAMISAEKNIKVIEWFFDNYLTNADLDVPIPSLAQTVPCTLRQSLMRRKQSAVFRNLIQKYGITETPVNNN